MPNEITNEAISTINSPRPRLLMVAYCFAPNGSMEERNGWQRALLATQHFDVTVAYFPSSSKRELLSNVPPTISESALNFLPVEGDRLSRFLKHYDVAFYLSYRLWHWHAYRAAKKLHNRTSFHASHLVTICGFREPGYVWKLGVPHVWGPLGGTHNFPKEFFHSINIWSQTRERMRSVVNHYQLNWSRRIRQGVNNSTALVAATMEARMDLESSFKKPMEVELETGIDFPVTACRQSRDPKLPLKVLWAGRLREWKGLPILLHAIAALPKEVSVQVRVLGSGSSKAGWTKLASKLGIADQIEWLPWPTYKETLQHYRWAETLAFTSLRDTSGTGLVEALAAGCPILGINHQGARDIMTPDCAIQVPADNWQTAVKGFSDGLTRLAIDSKEWQRLSNGSFERAKSYVWENRKSSIDKVYENIIKRISPTNPLMDDKKLSVTSSQGADAQTPRILIIAVACSPLRGSECAMGWNRALQSARFFETVVVTEEGEFSQEIRDYLHHNGPIKNLRFEYVANGKVGSFLRSFRLTYYLSYHLWQRRAYTVIQRLHKEKPLDLVHLATYCGFREPGIAWKLPIPFIFGPIGGTQNFPWRFLKSAGLKGAITEGTRSLLNLFQLRFGRAPRKAIHRSAELLAANTTVQADCKKYFGIVPEVRLESGITNVSTRPKPKLELDRPIRILWSGELRPRKALNLLLHAAAKLPKNSFEIRVLGKGPEQKRLQRLASKLGIAERTQFLGFLPRSDAMAQLEWADTFVFTSLRDTSGTVVLESLSMGLPVICLDHQGVRDIVNDECGIKIPVTTPSDVASSLARAIETLANSPSLSERLSAGALNRASDYLWDAHGEHMANVYRRTIKNGKNEKCRFLQ